jgi:hypothetical protein
MNAMDTKIYVVRTAGVVLFKPALPEPTFLSAPCEEVST